MTDDGTPKTAAGRRLLGLDLGPPEAYWTALGSNEMSRAILAIEAEATAAGDSALSLERLDHEETREALAETRALVTPDPAPEVERLRMALGPFAYHAFDEHDECRWCGVEIEWDHEPACPVPGAIAALSEADHAD